jgi:TolB protein
LALPLKLEKLTGTGQSSHVAISPDGKYLAYTQVIEKRPSIWLRQLATNTNVEIVPAAGPELIHGLVFANSGEYLYFVKGEPTALYRVSLLGGVPTKIVDNLEGNFSLSADDGQIVFVRRVINQDGQREVFLTTVNADGTGNRALLSTAHPNTLNVPLWSPDGGSIICAYYSRASGNQDASLIEVSVADGVKKELSSERFFQIAKLAWLPDKSGMIMSARRKHEDDNQLWQITYPGIEISQITEGIANFADLSIAATADKAAAAQAIHIAHIWVGSSREPLTLKKIVQGTNNFSWAPNGQIIYSSKSSGNVDVWAMKPDGTGQRQLTVNPAIDGMPAVTPDSRYIVFVSNRTGAYEIWRMSMDGSNQTQLTNSGGSRPAISPDGKWVLYNTSSLHLWKVSIEGGEPARLTEYSAYASAVSPDGKMIACVGRNESSRKLSVLVLPFEGGQPLKRFEFAGGGFRGFRVHWTPDGKALIYGIENNGKTAIIKQSLDGGQPQQIMDFDEDEMFDFGHSSDRKLFAVTRGAWQHDIVLISGLNQR